MTMAHSSTASGTRRHQTTNPALQQQPPCSSSTDAAFATPKALTKISSHRQTCGSEPDCSALSSTRGTPTRSQAGSNLLNESLRHSVYDQDDRRDDCQRLSAYKCRPEWSNGRILSDPWNGYEVESDPPAMPRCETATRAMLRLAGGERSVEGDGMAAEVAHSRRRSLQIYSGRTRGNANDDPEAAHTHHKHRRAARHGNQAHRRSTSSNDVHREGGVFLQTTGRTLSREQHPSVLPTEAAAGRSCTTRRRRSVTLTTDDWMEAGVMPVAARAAVQRRRSLQLHPGRPVTVAREGLGARKPPHWQTPGQAATSGDHYGNCRCDGGDVFLSETTSSCTSGGPEADTATDRTPSSHGHGLRGRHHENRRTLADVVALCEKLLSC